MLESVLFRRLSVGCEARDHIVKVYGGRQRQIIAILRLYRVRDDRSRLTNLYAQLNFARIACTLREQDMSPFHTETAVEGDI